MARTLKDMELKMLDTPGITTGVLLGYWPYGRDALGRPYFDLQAEALKGWIRWEGPTLVFDLDHPNSRARVEGAEVVIERG